MASIRIGFSSDFVLKNGVVGLGTTVGSTTDGKLELDNGALRANLSVTGVATLTAYGGFVAQKQHVNKPAAIGFGTVGLQTAGVGTAYQYYETETGFTDLGGVHHGDDQYFNTPSEDLVIDDGQILNITNTNMVGVTTLGEYDPHTHASYVCAGSLEQVSVTGHFSVPNGGINDRQETPIEGTVRFNDDLNTLEFFNGNEWRQFTYNQGQSGRGVWMGGEQVNGTTASEHNDYVSISTLGNSLSFGDLSTGNRSRLETAGASSIRGVFGNGRTPTNTDIIDYITIASNGKAIDFGNSQQASGGSQNAGVKSSSTRGVFSGGTPTNLQYIQIGTLGNSLAFGDLTDSNGNNGVSASTPTRGVYAVGTTTASIEAITFASTGSSVVFGECQEGKNNAAGAGNSVRGVFAGGYRSPGDRKSNNIEFVNLASLGNTQDFGDLTIFRACLRACSTQVRAVFGGGYFVPSTTASGGTNDNRIDYITIATAGNAQDFGDLSSGNIHGRGAALSDSHGGLGGF